MPNKPPGSFMIKMTIGRGPYPLMVGFALGLVVEKSGRTVFVATLGRWTWRWYLRDARIEMEETA